MTGLFLGIDVGTGGVRAYAIDAEAGIQGLAYQRFALLGAPALGRVISISGGARNEAWIKIRQRILGVPVTVAEQTEACFGAALLALQGGAP